MKQYVLEMEPSLQSTVVALEAALSTKEALSKQSIGIIWLLCLIRLPLYGVSSTKTTNTDFHCGVTNHSNTYRNYNSCV